MPNVNYVVVVNLLPPMPPGRKVVCAGGSARFQADDPAKRRRCQAAGPAGLARQSGRGVGCGKMDG